MVLEDCAEQLGYVGAAGVFTQLSHFAATIDLGSNAELGLVTLSPGMTCSLMRLSVVKGDGS